MEWNAAAADTLAAADDHFHQQNLFLCALLFDDKSTLSYVTFSLFNLFYYNDHNEVVILEFLPVGRPQITISIIIIK